MDCLDVRSRSRAGPHLHQKKACFASRLLEASHQIYRAVLPVEEVAISRLCLTRVREIGVAKPAQLLVACYLERDSPVSS